MSLSKVLKISLIVVFAVALGLLGYLTFTAVRDFVTSFEMASLPGIAIQEGQAVSPEEGEAGVVTDSSVPLQSSVGPTPPEWDGAKRVTILTMGLDYRDWSEGEGPPRTDSMILLTLDPLTKTAGMLSIPRDMWVNIPGGYKYGRINTAYQLGEAYKYPEGGGPGLAMDTVEELLGVPIDYYAQVDFDAFMRFIDEIGGIDVYVPQKTKVDPVGDNNNRTLKKGDWHMNGKLALAYARARHTEGGDFDRANRTQDVIKAIRKKILDANMLPELISKAGILYNQLQDGIHTNLSLDEALRLAWLAAQIPEENIKQGVIGPPDQVTLVTSPDGTQQVLKPVTDKIRMLRDEIFTNTGPVSPAAANADLASLVKEEGARVAVLNGSYTAGLAATTSDYLKSQGLNITQTDNAQTATPYTEITFYTGKPYTVKYLVELMGIDSIRIYHVNDPASPVDVTVKLGDTWANNNPMQGNNPSP
jgi:polyisoprenyl-teichoic acid--peptidoglycan teichoic acid transferase